MELRLDLKVNAFNSIYQGLVHLDNAISYNNEFRSKDIDFDHKVQMATFIKNGEISFILDDIYYIPPRYYELKFTVLLFTSGIELLLLDIVKSKNESDIFRKDGKTINFWVALKKVTKIIPDLLTDSQINSLKICKDLRNDLEHYEIESNYNELYKVTSELLSIINCIFQIHLHLNLVKFYNFDCWRNEFNDRFNFSINQTLQDLKKNGYSFNNTLIENKKDLSVCIYCDEHSYSKSENLCFFCLSVIDEELKNLL